MILFLSLFISTKMTYDINQNVYLTIPEANGTTNDYSITNSDYQSILN